MIQQGVVYLRLEVCVLVVGNGPDFGPVVSTDRPRDIATAGVITYRWETLHIELFEIG